MKRDGFVSTLRFNISSVCLSATHLYRSSWNLDSTYLIRRRSDEYERVFKFPFQNNAVLWVFYEVTVKHLDRFSWNFDYLNIFIKLHHFYSLINLTEVVEKFQYPVVRSLEIWRKNSCVLSCFTMFTDQLNSEPYVKV